MIAARVAGVRTVEEPKPQAASPKPTLSAEEVERPGDRRHPLDVRVTLYNWTAEERRANGIARVFDRRGQTIQVIGPEALVFPPRVAENGDLYSKSIDIRLEIDLAGADGEASIEVLLEEPATAARLGTHRLTVTR